MTSGSFSLTSVIYIWWLCIFARDIFEACWNWCSRALGKQPLSTSLRHIVPGETVDLGGSVALRKEQQIHAVHHHLLDYGKKKCQNWWWIDVEKLPPKGSYSCQLHVWVTCWANHMLAILRKADEARQTKTNTRWVNVKLRLLSNRLYTGQECSTSLMPL